MLNNTINQSPTSLGTLIILIAIITSSIGILFNLIIIIFLIHHGQFHRYSNKNTSRRIGLLHSINTYIHLIGILSTLLIMCMRTLYGDLYLKKRDEYSIPWHCHLLGYLLSLFAAGVYGSCFLQAIFRFYRIMISNRGFFQKLSIHILLILIHWILIIILLLPILSRSVYISSDHFCLSPFDDRWTAIYISLITAIIPVTGIFILYMKIVIYMKNHRKRRKRTKNDILIIRRIFILVIIILQTSSTGIILWILTFFNKHLHLLFYRFLRFLLILCMIMCSITLLILSPQLKRALRKNCRRYQKKNNIRHGNMTNNLEDSISLKTLPISEI